MAQRRVSESSRLYDLDNRSHRLENEVPRPLESRGRWGRLQTRGQTTMQLYRPTQTLRVHVVEVAAISFDLFDVDSGTRSMKTH